MPCLINCLSAFVTAIWVQHILWHWGCVQLFEEGLWNKAGRLDLVWPICWKWSYPALGFSFTEVERRRSSQCNSFRHKGLVSCQDDILVWHLQGNFSFGYHFISCLLDRNHISVVLKILNLICTEYRQNTSCQLPCSGYPCKSLSFIILATLSSFFTWFPHNFFSICM